MQVLFSVRTVTALLLEHEKVDAGAAKTLLDAPMETQLAVWNRGANMSKIKNAKNKSEFI